jgi:hypothetical protein
LFAVRLNIKRIHVEFMENPLAKLMVSVISLNNKEIYAMHDGFMNRLDVVPNTSTRMSVTVLARKQLRISYRLRIP